MVLQVPIVVVGNKTDQARTTAQPELEAVASLDWEHGYVECSARDNYNVDQVIWSPGDGGDGDGDGGGVQVFKELLHQAKSRFDFRAPVSGSGRGSLPGTPLVMRRRTSLPQVMVMMMMLMMMLMMMMVLQVPAFSRLMQSSGDTAEAAAAKKVEKRSHSFALSRRRDSCKVQ